MHTKRNQENDMRVETAGDIFGITQIPYNKPTF